MGIDLWILHYKSSKQLMPRKALLNTTNATIRLARTINQGRADGEGVSLHRAFLSGMRRGLSLSTKQDTNNNTCQILWENPLVDSLLHTPRGAFPRLDLAFSPSTLQIAYQTDRRAFIFEFFSGKILIVAADGQETSLGHFLRTFSVTLCLLALTDGQRLHDVAHIIKGMKSKHQIDYFSECLTKDLLFRLIRARQDHRSKINRI
jgi:hypothetical protein